MSKYDGDDVVPHLKNAMEECVGLPLSDLLEWAIAEIEMLRSLGKATVGESFEQVTKDLRFGNNG